MLFGSTGHKKLVFKKRPLFGKEKEIYLHLFYPYDYENTKQSERIAIIFLHGLGSTKHTFFQMISKSLFKNYLVFIPDFEPVTTPPEKGIIRQAFDETEFLLDKIRDYADNIFVIGHSLGGYIALYSMIKGKRKNVKGLCLMSTPYSLREVMFKLSIGMLGFIGEGLDGMRPLVKQLEKQVPGFSISWLRRKFYFYKFRFSTINNVKEMYDAPNLLKMNFPKMPIMLIHGIDDHLVNFSHSVMMFQKLKETKSDVRMHLITHGHHILGGNHKSEVTEKIDSWIKEIMLREKESKKK